MPQKYYEICAFHFPSEQRAYIQCQISFILERRVIRKMKGKTRQICRTLAEVDEYDISQKTPIKLSNGVRFFGEKLSAAYIYLIVIATRHFYYVRLKRKYAGRKHALRSVYRNCLSFPAGHVAETISLTATSINELELKTLLTWRVVRDGFAHFPSFGDHLVQNVVVLDVRQTILVIGHFPLETHARLRIIIVHTHARIA